MGARNRVGIGFRTGPPGYIGWRNSFLGFYKRLKIRARYKDYGLDQRHGKTDYLSLLDKYIKLKNQDTNFLR
jgi:hypothetical protein